MKGTHKYREGYESCKVCPQIKKLTIIFVRTPG